MKMTTTLARPVSSQISPLMSAIAYPLGTHLLLPSYFSQIDIQGQDKIPTHGPVILAPTHRSRWDALIVPYATGRNVSGRYLRFMVSADEMKGLQGWVIRRLGGFPVDTRRVNLASLSHCTDLLCAGEMLVIFPEGNIFRQDAIAPLKRGLARVALQAQARCPETVQILPISLSYSRRVPRRSTRVRVVIGDAIAVCPNQSSSMKQASQQLTQVLQARLSALHDCVRLAEPEEQNGE